MNQVKFMASGRTLRGDWALNLTMVRLFLYLDLFLNLRTLSKLMQECGTRLHLIEMVKLGLLAWEATENLDVVKLRTMLINSVKSYS